MKKINGLARNLAEAFKSIFRNKIMSLTSVVTVSACLFIVLLMCCVAINLNSVLADLESDVQITVYVEDSLGEEGMNALFNAIRDNVHVIDIKYVSRDENMESWLESTGMDPVLFSGFNPLRRSYVVTVDNGENILQVVDWLNSDEMAAAGVSTVNHAASVIEVIVSINNVIRIVFIVIIAVLGVLSVVIITNTIKLTINSRRSEISIMKYIGSTDRFIRWPFVIEGFLLGASGAVAPATVFIIFYDRIIELIAVNFPFITTVIQFKQGIEIFPVLAPITLILGGAIGTVASFTTIRKYLDV